MIFYASLIVAYALFIWLRDLSWWHFAEDTLPILAAFPLFYYFGEPWKIGKGPLKSNFLIAAVLLFLAGIILNMNLLLAFSWIIAFKALPFELPSPPHLNKLLAIPFFGFPWVSFDANGIGWTFRLTGAQVTAHFFSFLGYPVSQEGTHLLIDGHPISVEAACAGLNTLQSMMIAGLLVAFLYLKDSRWMYWLNIPLLLVLAWVANTLRIILISWAALLYGASFALGAFHLWGGLLVIVIMFLLAWLMIKGQAKWI